MPLSSLSQGGNKLMTLPFSSDKISSELYLNDVDEIMVFLSDLNHKNEESLELLEELMDKAGGRNLFRSVF